MPHFFREISSILLRCLLIVNKGYCGFVLDVCGFFVTLYEVPISFKAGSLHRELILVLEDLSSVGFVPLFRCRSVGFILFKFTLPTLFMLLGKIY